MRLKSSRTPTSHKTLLPPLSPKSSPAQQMKSFMKASPIKLRKPKAKPPPAKGASSAASTTTSKNIDMPQKLTQDASAIKLNQLRSKYGIKPISFREQKDEQPTAKEADNSEREAIKEAAKEVVKEVESVEQENVKQEQPSYIDTEKMWMSVEAMTRKSAAAINPVWEKLLAGSGGGGCSLAQHSTAEEKGLAVIAAFANYKALQAKAEQKALDVAIGRQFCNESTSVKQMHTRSLRQQVLVGEFEMAQKEKFAAKSTVMSMWSSLTAAERKAVGGLGEIEKDIFEGIESDVFSKLSKISKDIVCPGAAFVYGADDEATENASTIRSLPSLSTLPPTPRNNEVSGSGGSNDKSPVDNTTQNVDAASVDNASVHNASVDNASVHSASVHSTKSLRDDKVEKTGNDDAALKTIATVSDGTSLSERVHSLLIDPLVAKLQEKDDATQETSTSNKSSLAKIGLDTLLFGDDHEDDTTLNTAETGTTENTAETDTIVTGTTDHASVRSKISLLGKIEESFTTCGAGDHATVFTEEKTFASGNSGTDGSNTFLLEKLNETMACVGSDDCTTITTITGGTFENTLCTEEEIGHDDKEKETKLDCQPEESLAPEKMKRTSSTKSAMSARSAASVPSTKQSLPDAPSVARSVKSIASIKSVGTAETTETTESMSIESAESLRFAVVSHEDEDQSQASDASTVFVYRSTIGEALSCQKWLQLFSREDEVKARDGYKTAGRPSVTLPNDYDDGDDDASLMTHISKKPEVIYQNSPGEIEVHRRNSKEMEPVAFEDDVPMMAHSHKTRYEQEIVSQRDFITHAFIKCDDFFTGLFCCQDSVEATLQKSEVEEWNECYRNCKKFLRQEDDDFVDEEAFTAWLNMQEAQVTKAENALSMHRVYKLKSLLMPITTEQRRQYEELRIALDDAVMAKLHGIENVDYAIKKAAVTEFNKNYYNIMLKGENHDIVVQQVARIIEGLGFERTLPPPPPTRAQPNAEKEKKQADNSPIDNVINYLKEFEIEIYNSDTELRVRLDKLKFTFYTDDVSLASNESNAQDDDCSFADSVSERTKEVNCDAESLVLDCLLPE